MTGDLGEAGEADILARTSSHPDRLRADILKVGHHGSRFSTTDGFLAAVRPRYAVIQSGRNNFGHPTRPVLEKLSAAGIVIGRNDLDGAIRFGIRNGRITRVDSMQAVPLLQAGG
jgi:competence protein ComEC